MSNGIMYLLDVTIFNFTTVQTNYSETVSNAMNKESEFDLTFTL